MSRHDADWHDRQYNNRGRIPDHPAILQDWFDRSAAARRQLRSHLDQPYGDGGGETLDVFPAERAAGDDTSRTHQLPGAPILIYIHGGYWRALDKRDQSFIALPFVRTGAMVVLPNHALCPAVSVEHITLQLVRAVSWVYRHAAQFGGDAQRIVVAGHSAGGHLATMMLCCRWPEVAPDLPSRLVRSALSVSGVFDLAPLRHAPFLAPDLGLSATSAYRLSPLRMPAPVGPLLAVVGGDESEAFLSQHRAIARAWGRRAVPICETVPGRHHMNVLNALAEPASHVHRLALGLLGLSAEGGTVEPSAGRDLHRARR